MTHTLLLIEDDHRLAQMVGEYLVQSGFSVRHAPTGAQGLELLQSHIPDMVLLDLNDTAYLPYNSAARQLVYTETGRSIDKVMIDFGYPMGPFAVSDLSGLDVSYDTRKRRAAADPDFRKLHVPDRMVELGRKGQKTSAGWYRYEAGDRTPHVDEEVKRIIRSVAAELGTEQRAFTDEEILRRLLFASINEAESD
mgnify:CR=1 FL=1